MVKVVRVLIVIILLLSIGALMLGNTLFGKREILKGRTKLLEDAVVRLGAVIEAEAPRAAPQTYPARDISPATVEYINEQDFSAFWDNYSNALEVVDLPTMQLGRRAEELMRFYARDAAGRIKRDATGMRETRAPGTLHAVLEELTTRAGEQYNRLNETRLQLANTRAELVAAVQDLNQSKRGFRTAQQQVRGLEGDVARLEGDVRQSQQRVQELQQEKRELEVAVAEERHQVQLLREEVARRQDEIESLVRERERRGTITQDPSAAPVIAQRGDFVVPSDHTEKGTIVTVDGAWNFVVMALEDHFMRDLLGENLDQPLPPVELMVKRRVDGRDQFVTKIRLLQIRRDRNLGVADIMTDWQQMAVREGDIVFY